MLYHTINYQSYVLGDACKVWLISYVAEQAILWSRYICGRGKLFWQGDRENADSNLGINTAVVRETERLPNIQSVLILTVCGVLILCGNAVHSWRLLVFVNWFLLFTVLKDSLFCSFIDSSFKITDFSKVGGLFNNRHNI